MRPASTGSGESVFWSDRSAREVTVVVAVARLLELSGSAVSLLTRASFCSSPVVPGNTLTTTVIVAPVSGASVANVQTLGRSGSPGTPALHDD